MSTIEYFEQRQATYQKVAADMRVTLHAQTAMFDALQAAGAELSYDMTTPSIDIRAIGSSKVLAEVWKMLRSGGWEPDTRPADKQIYFTTFWRREGALCRLYLSFSSTVCRQVQTGTITKEVPVYDVVCDEATGEAVQA